LIGIIDNDEKVASSKKLTKFKTGVQNPDPTYDQWLKIDTLLMIKTAEKLYPLGSHIPI